MFKSTSTSLILLGVLAIIIALTWPGPTALVLVLIVAIWAFTPRRRGGHHRAAVRPVQPDLRDLADHAGHPAAPGRADPALSPGGCGLTCHGGMGALGLGLAGRLLSVGQAS